MSNNGESSTNLDAIIGQLDQAAPKLVIIDSIQTVYLDEMGSAPGSVGQIRDCTIRLVGWAKSAGVPVLISGHVTKDGALAGPQGCCRQLHVSVRVSGGPGRGRMRAARGRYMCTDRDLDLALLLRAEHGRLRQLCQASSTEIGAQSI